jgi:hypothetical protein
MIQKESQTSNFESSILSSSSVQRAIPVASLQVALRDDANNTGRPRTETRAGQPTYVDSIGEVVFMAYI